MFQRESSGRPAPCSEKHRATFSASSRASGRSRAQEHLAKNLGEVEILPLYARLSPAEQQRIFQSHTGRRIVLSTNVAETSLTVPGIHAVIDTGTARISRFNRRTKVQRLPIEPISQASADQRSGRCGRLGPGVAIRLYDEPGFLDRPEFTEPEVQRTNLASVVLRMASLGLGDAESFPFVDPPEARAIRDGVTLLEELDAIDPRHVGTDRWLTELGAELAAIPVDPKLARMLLEAQDHGCVTEVAIIVAGLSVQDPHPAHRSRQRRRRRARRATARSLHRSGLRFHVVAAAVGPHQGRTQRTQRQRLSHNVSQRVPALPADSGVGGRPSPTLRHRHRASASASTGAGSA